MNYQDKCTHADENVKFATSNDENRNHQKIMIFLKVDLKQRDYVNSRFCKEESLGN